MKADMSFLKEQMASMMDAMLGMRQLMENNVAIAAAVSSAAEADPTLPATAHHPLPNMVGRERNTLGTSATPIWDTTEWLTLMDYHLITRHQSCMMMRVMSLPPSLKGSLLDSRMRFTRIVESMPKETSISTPRSSLRGWHPTHCLSPTSQENLETSQHSHYSFPQKDRPRQRKKKGNSISSKRD